MPVRTVVEEFCDICFNDEKQRETVATDHLRFGWQGRDYVLLACQKHVGSIRDEIQKLSEIATLDATGRRASGAPRQARAAGSAARQTGKTLFSQLSDVEKERFRKWADMPNARRISDIRVQEWTSAGKP